MAWWDDVQQAIADQNSEPGGGSQQDTPPNLDWSAIGNIFDQTAQYASGSGPQNLNWPDQQQQQPDQPQQQQQQTPDFGWVDSVKQVFQDAGQYARNGYQLNQPDPPAYAGPYAPGYMPRTPQYQTGLSPEEQSQAQNQWAQDWGYDQPQPQPQDANPLDTLNQVVGNTAARIREQPDLHLAPGNPDDYWGNIYRGIRVPAQQNALTNSREGKMPWDVAAEAAGNVVGGLLGGLGAAVTPIGGAVDAVANSGIPVLSQYAQLGRGFYENVDEPIFNATPSIVGDIANGEFPNVIKNAVSNLNPFDSYDQTQITATKLKYVQDAYNSAVGSGMNDEQATQVALNLDRRLGNFANLTEYAGMEKFGTLPALAQLGIMLLDPVGNLGGEALLAGRLPKGLTEGRIARSTLGGRLGRTTLDGVDVARNIGDVARTTQNALQYVAPMSQAGKVIGGLSDITGLSGLLDSAGNALKAPLQRDTRYSVEAEEPIRAIENYARANPLLDERTVMGEYLNNPESGIYHERIGAPQELTDYLRKAYDYQPMEAGDPVLQTQQELVKPFESKLGADEQVTAGAGKVPDAEAAPYVLPEIDKTAPFENQKSNFIADTITERAEALQKGNSKLNLADLVEQVRATPEIQNLLDTITTPEELAAARREAAVGKPPPLEQITPEMNAATAASFAENLPARPATRMPSTPLPLKYTGVTLPKAKGATVSEFYNTSRQLKGIDSGYLKLDSTGPRATLRTIKPLENIPVLGAPLRGYENLTHQLFARPFLNTFSRMVRDAVGNLVKLGVQDPAGLAGYVTAHLKGGRDTVSTLYEKYNGDSTPISTGHASASADVSYSQGKSGFFNQLWYIVANPTNEIAALGIRTAGKALGKLDAKGPVGKFGRDKAGNFSPTQVTEKFEQSLKDYLGKREYVRTFQSKLADERRKGTFDKARKQPGFENLPDDVILAHAVAGTLPKGADLADYVDKVYNPSNFSPEVLNELNEQVLSGGGGPLGNVIKQTLEGIDDLRETAKAEIRAARDKEVAIARDMKDKKAGGIRANTALTLAEGKLREVDRLSPTHPLVVKLWDDARRQVDNTFTAQSAVAVSDPKLVAAYKKLANDVIDYAAKTGDFLGVKQSILKEMELREPSYIQQFQKKAAGVAEPAQPSRMPSKPPEKTAAAPNGSGLSSVQQAVLDWSEKRYMKLSDRDATLPSAVADIGKHNMGRARQRSQIKKWLSGEELGGKAKAERVLMYEPDRSATAGNPVYWMSNKSKGYDPAFEVPRGKQPVSESASANVPRETQGQNGSSATTSGVTTPPANPARTQEVLQGYYDSFFKTEKAGLSHDFSANEIRDKIKGSKNKTQTLQDYKDYLLKSDAELRRITGNRFKLDLDTMTPIGNTGSSFEGKYLTELVGKGKPYEKVKGPLPPSLPKEVAGMKMPEMLDAVKAHYGPDAVQDFAAMDPLKRDAILNEMAETFLGVKAVDPLTLTDKASREQVEAHRLLGVALDDMKARYVSDTAANTRGRAASEDALAQQQQNTQSILAIRNRIAIQAHAAGYGAVKSTYFDYRNKNTVDQLLGGILPYQYWARQNFAYAMRHFATNPMHFAALLNFYQTLEKENSDPSIPDYAKGDIFLWQNPDGSKVLWDFSSIFPFNPLSSNDSIMQVVSPGDSTGRTIRNTDPLAILFGTDSVSATSGKVIARDKGILPSFFRPNPILELAFKTGNVNKALQSLGIARGSQSLLGQDYPESTRAQKETTGFLPGNSFYQEMGAATGLTRQLRSMGVIKADLSPQSLLDERLFGQNAGKPQTKIIQELTGMAQRGEISPEQGKAAIAAYKEGNWTPEALKALDAVQGENAGRRLLTNIGFSSIVTNTPRQQLASKLYAGLSRAYDGQGSQSIIGPDGKKMYVPSDTSKFYTANPGAGVLASAGKTSGQINQGLSNDKTRAAYSALVQQSISKQISARDFNLKLAGLQASNPQYFIDNPLKQGPKEQLYNEQLSQYQKIGGDKYDTLSKQAYALSRSGDKAGAAAIYNSTGYKNAKTSRDQFMDDNPDFKSSYVAYLKSKGQDYKEPNPQEQKYFDQLDAYKSIGGAAYDARAKAVSDAYAAGNKTLGAKLYKDPAYIKYKTARDVYMADHPDFKAQYDAYNKAQYGTDPKEIDLNAPLSGSTSRFPASSSSTFKKTGYTTTTATAKKPFVPYTPAQKKTFASSGSGSGSTAFTPYTPAQKQGYAKAIAAGKSPAYAQAVARNIGAGTAGNTSTASRLPQAAALSATPNFLNGAGYKLNPSARPGTAAQTRTPALTPYTQAQKVGYAKAINAGKSQAYAVAVARNIGLTQGAVPLTKPIVNQKTIANTNTPGYTGSGNNSKYVSSVKSGVPVYRRPAQQTASRLPSRSRSYSNSTRLPYDAIRFSPGRTPRKPVRFG